MLTFRIAAPSQEDRKPPQGYLFTIKLVISFGSFRINSYLCTQHRKMQTYCSIAL